MHVVVRQFLAGFQIRDGRSVEAIEMAGAKLNVCGAVVACFERLIADRAAVRASEEVTHIFVIGHVPNRADTTAFKTAAAKMAF